VVELDGVQPVFATSVPRLGRGAEAQTVDALRQLGVLLEAVGARRGVVQQTVFLADMADLPACRAVVDAFYGADRPATTYIPQRLLGGPLVGIEAWAMSSREGGVAVSRDGDTTRVRHDGLEWIHVGGVTPGTDAPPGVYGRVGDALGTLAGRLDAAGAGFEDVLRTWLYLGEIVGPEGNTQRYKELNRARSDRYAGVDFLAGLKPPGHPGRAFPASTGIGAEGRDFHVAALALRTDRPDLRATPLENPRQVSAFDYAERYSPKSPLFSRGLALSWGTGALIFISGTASITRSETRHVGDVVAQTHETLDNIEALVAPANLGRHGLAGLGANLDELAIGRVYVKWPEHERAVRAACEARLPGVPLIYTCADVCRPDLLVEIEGVVGACTPPS
jgi:enamine deaminase RidA (YjgF/YER057c/UK114 family)